jgi:hypothetical protein
MEDFMIKVGPWLFALSFFVVPMGCKKQNSSGTQSSSSTQKKTACLSFQGNGVYFPSHIGALIALLENNIEPVFAVGGSSGSIIAALSRAVVDNATLSPSGSFRPQDAALVLAASLPMVESTLFLPRFNTPLRMLDSLDVFLSGSKQGVLAASPDNGMISPESIVGQSALIINFFRSADFRQLIRMNSLQDREKEIVRLWKNYANAIAVTPEMFAEALLVDRNTLMNSKRNDLVEIQDRIFGLFRSVGGEYFGNYKDQQESWNQLLVSNQKMLGADNGKNKIAMFKTALEKAKALESFDALYATLSGPFLLPDPARVFMAYQGVEYGSQKRIEIPTNTIIHATARRARKTDGSWKELKGLSALHQVYFANTQQAAEFSSRLTNPQHNPLQPQNGQMQPVIPGERIVVSGQSLGPSLTASTGEPAAFVRSPINLDVASRGRLGWTTPDETLVGYGGWLEKISLGTAMQFDQCAPNQVDLYFFTSDGGGVGKFNKMAFLGLFVDEPYRGALAEIAQNPALISKLLSGSTNNSGMLEGQAQREFDALVASTEQLFIDGKSAKAKQGNVPVLVEHAKPSDLGGADGERQSIVIRSNRRALVLTAYEKTRKILAQQNLLGISMKLWNEPGEKISISSLPTPELVQAAIERIAPRMQY